MSNYQCFLLPLLTYATSIPMNTNNPAISISLDNMSLEFLTDMVWVGMDQLHRRQLMQ